MAQLNALAKALQTWPDTRQEKITREQAAQIAEKWHNPNLPVSASADFWDGWDAAVETIAMALRFRDHHL